MRKLLIVLLLCATNNSFAQFGINFHQSNLPFVGFNFEIKDRIVPELRIGTDTYFEDTTIEGVILFKIVRKEDFEFYGGLGGRTITFSGLVIPFGLNIYPLSGKRFGFHIEIAPIIGDGSILRGSWGIRYRFKKE